VRRWDPLSERQLTLLRRIADGDDLSGPDGAAHRVSARGLQTRRLVDVSRKGGVWRARITEVGTFYLDHGFPPDHPDRLTTALVPQQRTSATEVDDHDRPTISGKPTPASRRIPSPTADQAGELIERLRKDGTIRVANPDDAARARYRKVIHAAKQHGLVPAGFHLLHTGRDSGDIVIRLSDDATPDDTDWNRIRLNTRRITTDPTIVFTALEKDPANLEVAEASIPRALALIRALAAEATLRGHRIGVNTRTKHPRVYLQLGPTRRSVTLTEERDQVPHVSTAEERKTLRRAPWMRPPEFDTVSSGRLRLHIARDGWNRDDSWADDKRTRLETRLRRIIRAVEDGVAADERERLAQEKARQAAADEWRRKEEETRQRWLTAMAEARTKAAEKVRQSVFRDRYDAWVAANEIRAFCAALNEPTPETDHSSANLSRWIAWATATADAMDPTRNPAVLAQVDFDVEPGHDDLRPFLGDWSPREPVREYRSASDQQRLDDIRRSTAWHPGMRGRPTWWRH
jgi:hypothetical protein